MEKNTNPNIPSQREEEQEVNMTLDQIAAEKAQKAVHNTYQTDEEVKASTDAVNPDEASLDSRG